MTVLLINLIIIFNLKKILERTNEKSHLVSKKIF